MRWLDSINNLIRSDRPESPTDAMFVFVTLALVGMQTYSMQTGKVVPYFIEMLAFLGTIKGIKVGSDYQKKRKAACDDLTAPQG